MADVVCSDEMKAYFAKLGSDTEELYQIAAGGAVADEAHLEVCVKGLLQEIGKESPLALVDDRYEQHEPLRREVSRHERPSS